MKRLLVLGLAALTLAPPAAAKDADVRFATYNASLNRFSAGQLEADLSTPNNAQAKAVAEIVQRVGPDVLLINEFDFAPAAVGLFQDNYLSIGQNGAPPIDYGFTFIAPSNTGVPSGFDLDNNGLVGGPNDALGFGFFPGQFGMAVYSKHPIQTIGIRTFKDFLWKDMPGALLPDDPATPAPADWYSPAELDIFPLSSKSHWDIPILIDRKIVHFLVSHPTPPVFDGAEDRNGTRNHDEIRFWADYITPARSGYIYDDEGTHGGLEPGAFFVIAGDQNSDPLDGDSIPGAIQQLIEHPLVNTKLTPSSESAAVIVDPANAGQPWFEGGLNLVHKSDPHFDTANFNDAPPGNLRADYVLPRKGLQLVETTAPLGCTACLGVFWPLPTDPLFSLVGVSFPSDHRAVWIDVAVPAAH